ncbi:MAG: hypothetical protein ACKORI_08925, partial [Verrucomicrobiota bacterium]
MGGFLDRLRAGLGRTAEALSNLLSRPMDGRAAEELRERLIAADFGPETADEVVGAAQEAWKSEAALRAAGPAEAAAAALERALGGPPPPLAHPAQGPLVVVLLGVNGAGKTTTAAKLAARWAREGRTCLLGACDTFRAAAGEQLAAWGARVGTETVGGAAGADPAAVAFDAVRGLRQRSRDAAAGGAGGGHHVRGRLVHGAVVLAGDAQADGAGGPGRS